MTARSSVSDAAPRAEPPPGASPPPPEVAAFIGYCHRLRGATWPELYDEMCAVAARREFNGWDHAELSARGLTFSLTEMPRLAAWCRAVVALIAEERDPQRQAPMTHRQAGARAAVA